MCTTTQALVDAARSRVRHLSPIEVEARLLARDSVLVDIRESEELAEHGRIAEAIRAPRGILEFWADPTSALHRPELDPARPTIVYCAVGNRSALAVQTLESLGYRDVCDLEGGIAAWKRAGLPVVGLKPWHDTTDPVTHDGVTHAGGARR